MPLPGNPVPKPPTVTLYATPPQYDTNTLLDDFESDTFPEPDCTCFSLYEDGDGSIMHHADCAVIQYRLGLYIY